MKVTGRLPAKKHTPEKAVVVANGGDIERQARVIELRGMVRAKRYKVDSYKLAGTIFARAMAPTRLRPLALPRYMAASARRSSRFSRRRWLPPGARWSRYDATPIEARMPGSACAG